MGFAGAKIIGDDSAGVPFLEVIEVSRPNKCQPIWLCSQRRQCWQIVAFASAILMQARRLASDAVSFALPR